MWSQDLYWQAWNFAAHAHHQQKYPGTDLPYIVHLGGVCMEVMTALSFEEVEVPSLAVQCALLHDILEDTSVTYQELENKFGKTVADGVQALTKNESLEKSQQMQDSLQRIRLQPTEVWMVKLSDRISNLQTPPHYWPQEKIKNYWIEAKEILPALGDASLFLSDRLQSKLTNYQQYF
ncbi:MAG: (p)ppGpp synthase/HD superfamily hydrolase [bacterium]|jgi:(p)ppGpp synthase/HD superfamily hydrolase